jgi:hypothetical protein
VPLFILEPFVYHVGMSPREYYVLHGMVTVRPLTVMSLSSHGVSLVFHHCITAVESYHVVAVARVVALKRAGLDDDGGGCLRGPCRVWWP